MLRKSILLLSPLLSIAVFSQAQSKKTAIVKGKLQNETSKSPLGDIKVAIPRLNVFTRSDGAGSFEISEVPYGAQTLIISSSGTRPDTINVSVDKDIIDLSTISLVAAPIALPAENTEIPTISIADNNVSGSEQGESPMGGEELLIASKDPYVSTVQNLTAYFFRARGLRANEAVINV